MITEDTAQQGAPKTVHLLIRFQTLLFCRVAEEDSITEF